MRATGGRDRCVYVDVDDAGGRGGVVGVLALVVAFCELLGEALLLVAGGVELVGVLERAGELLAAGGGFAQRLGALRVEPGGELGERQRAMLELADQRQAGVGELGALQRGRLGRQPV